MGTPHPMDCDEKHFKLIGFLRRFYLKSRLPPTKNFFCWLIS